MDWLYTIFIGTIFFILGQLFLRKSFDTENSPIQVSLLFSSAIGIFSILTIIYMYNQKGINFNYDIINPILAGLVFFIGFFFWIQTISSKESLGLIRIAMAGFETIILFVLSHLFFNDMITLKQLIGTIIILLGITVTSL
jgi:uncharacterized membrane protein